MNQTIKEWKVLESEYLVRRPWLTARRDRLELPDGRIIPEYYVLEYPDWVNVIAITKDGQFVMERQYRHAARKISLELPCGVMEEGETPLEAAQRELLEETGFGGGQWKKTDGAISQSQCDEQHDTLLLGYRGGKDCGTAFG